MANEYSEAELDAMQADVPSQLIDRIRGYANARPLGDRLDATFDIAGTLARFAPRDATAIVLSVSGLLRLPVMRDHDLES
jgi:hypothetical protein